MCTITYNSRGTHIDNRRGCLFVFPKVTRFGRVRIYFVEYNSPIYYAFDTTPDRLRKPDIQYALIVILKI